MNATLNIILTRLRQFVDNHHILQRFSFGQIDTVDLDKFGSYPLLHVVPGQESIDTVCTWSFDVYILDKPRDKDEHSKQDYQKHVLSDTAQCMRDLVAEITNGGNVFVYSENWSINVAVPAQYITQAFNHTLSGVFATVEISYPWGIDACNLPMSGVTPADLSCLDATVTVNGEAFDTVPSGGTLDVPVEYENGTPVGTITAGVVVIPDPTCQDANVEVNGTAYDTVPSGGTLDVAVENTLNNPVGSLVGGAWQVPDGDITLNSVLVDSVPSDGVTNIVIENTANAPVGSLVGADWVVPDGDVENSDTTYTASVASGATLILPDITITEPDATTISWPAVKNFDVRTLKSGIAYKRPFYSQKNSYATGDEGSRLQAGTYDYTAPPYPEYCQQLDRSVGATLYYYTLLYNNAFGNKNRFTTAAGVAVTNGAGIAFIDHLTGLMWFGSQQSQSTWSSAFTTVTNANNANTGGYNDWRLPAIGEWYTAFNYEGGSAAFIAPFENFGANIFWSATTNPASTGQAMTVFSGRAISQQTKSVSTNRAALVRTFYP